MSVSMNANILGGSPVIKGTRIPVSLILGYIADGYTIDDILEDFPYLTKETIQEALDWGGEMGSEWLTPTT